MSSRRPRRPFETVASTRVESRDATLARLRKPLAWPEWQSEISATEGPEEVAAGDHVTGDATMLGFAVGGRADILHVGDDGLEQDVIVGIRMRVRYELTEDPSGWRLTHRLTVDLPGGASGRVLSFFLKRRLRRMQGLLIRKLAAPSPPTVAPAVRVDRNA